jgi:hypothetical protein
MPSSLEIRFPRRQRPDTLQVIGQNDAGLDGKLTASAGRLNGRPKITNMLR